MKIFLLFPPHWTPSMPHLALPVLTGFLRKHGHEVIQRDMNLETFDRILTRSHLRGSLDRIRARFRAKNNQSSFGEQPPETDVQWAVKEGAKIADQVEGAKAMLRSGDFFVGEKSEPHFMTLVDALELVSLAHFPARLEWTIFADPGRADSSRDLFKAIRDPNTNPFYEIFKQGVIKDIQREKPDIVGISIPTQSQLLAGMTLAGLIRDSGVKCHITVGGPHITMLRERLARVPKMFDLIDSAVLFEGELPLLELIQALQTDGDLSRVPNLVYRASGSSTEVRTNPAADFGNARAAEEDNQPDFDGLPLERYLAPELVLPLATTHGCYYGKCAFCNVGYGSSSPFGYFPIPTAHVLEQVSGLQDKYQCRNFFFVDEAITPRIMRDLSAALIEKGSPINWTVAARFERALTDELLGGAAKSGCRMLLYGLESASEPVMKSMVKGTSRQEMGRILTSAAELGIWNHTFFFFGFPGEMLENAQETVNFVYEYQHAIHSASPGAFVLEIYSPAYRDPAKFGIIEIIDPPERDLAIYFEYRLKAGMDEAQANLVAERFNEQLPDKRFGQYYMNDVIRFLYASELTRQQKTLPRWIE